MPEPVTLSQIRVFATAGDPRRGVIVAGGMVIPCALGKGRIRHDKREGDGATPVGVHHAVRGYYRADRIGRPFSRVPFTPLRLSDGWCDAPGHRSYNRKVALPFPARHERMWRDDHVYDIVIDLGWNASPRIQGRGSAIFLHLARDNLQPTEGCIAVPADKILRLLARIGPNTRIVVAGKPKPLRRRQARKHRDHAGR